MYKIRITMIEKCSYEKQRSIVMNLWEATEINGVSFLNGCFIAYINVELKGFEKGDD